MSNNLIEYEPYTPDVGDADAARADALSGSVFYSIDVGDNILRVIPPLKGRGYGSLGRSPFRLTAMHYIEVPGMQQKMIYACPRVELKQPCAACMRATQLSESASPIDRSKASNLKSSTRVLASVRDRRIAEVEDSLRILDITPGTHRQFRALLNRFDFTNPTASGVDSNIHREGTGQKDTKYVVSLAFELGNRPLGDSDEEIGWLISNQFDLNAHVLQKAVPPVELQGALGMLGALTGAQVQVPAAISSGPRVGGALMSAAGQAAVGAPPPRHTQRAVHVGPDGRRYDENFNPIDREGP